MEQKQIMNEYILLVIQSFLENSQDLLFFKDENLVYRGASATFARITGYEHGDDLVGKTDFDLFDEKLARRYTEDDRKVLEKGNPIIDQLEPLPDENGKKKYSSTSKYIIRKETGEIAGLYGVARDVSAQVELREEQEQRQLSRHMFEDVLEADLTENKMLRTDGSRWVKIINLTDENTFEESVILFAKHFIHLDYVSEFIDFYAIDKLRKEYENGVEEIRHISYQRIDGEGYKWIEFCSRLYYSQVSKTLRLITFLKDLDDQIKTRDRLTKKAETDALTGLFNRESTMHRIKECLYEYHLERHFLLFVDLDNFKEINDQQGHPFGDMVIQRVADKLALAFRGADIVGRIGGDEFMVLIKDVPSKEIVEVRAHQLFDAIHFPSGDRNEDIQVTCSIGAAEYTEGKTFKQLYSEADQAMYSAKKAGKNTFAFY